MLKDAIHEAEECGYRAEVPSIPDCATQDETFEELLGNLYDAVEGCLLVDVDEVAASEWVGVIDGNGDSSIRRAGTHRCLMPSRGFASGVQDAIPELLPSLRGSLGTTSEGSA